VRVHPYVAISREYGVDGAETGRRVADALGSECLDSELLTFVAQKYDVPKTVLELVDETTSNWLRDVLQHWLDSRVITQDEYVMRLGEVMLLAARHGPVVFVGRGAQFLLPRDRGLAVRLIAPLDQRIAATMSHDGLDRVAAEARVHHTDQGRADFVRHHFQRDVADPRLYDVIVNLENLSTVAAAQLIVEAHRRRFG
jgi:cytidylate kinase